VTVDLDAVDNVLAALADPMRRRVLDRREGHLRLHPLEELLVGDQPPRHVQPADGDREERQDHEQADHRRDEKWKLAFHAPPPTA
jgi:hypothetical protein